MTMPAPDRCSVEFDALADWLAGCLAPADAASVAVHVATCPACRAEVDALRRMAHSVREDAATRATRLIVPAYTPPPPRRPAIAPRFALPWLGRADHRRYPVLRVAAGLAAVVAVAAGLATRWPAGRPRTAVRVAGPGATSDSPYDWSADARPGRGQSIASAPTIVVRRPTEVVRSTAVALAAAPSLDRRAGADGADRPPLDVPDRIAPAIEATVAPPTHAPADPVRRSTSRSVEATTPAGSMPRATATNVPAATEGAPTPTVPSPVVTMVPPPVPPTAPPIEPTALPTALPAVPTITGIVIGGDGAPLMGATIVAEPWDGGGRVVASTGADGRYTLEVASGRWLVHAEAGGYAMMWRGGVPSPLAAEPVVVGAGTADVDFALEPAAVATIRGRVVDGAGRGVAGAFVFAVRPGDGQTAAGEPVAVAYTGGDGGYALPVAPGAWLVAAAVDWRRGSLAWWGGDGTIIQADRVGVDEGASVAEIDIEVR